MEEKVAGKNVTEINYRDRNLVIFATFSFRGNLFLDLSPHLILANFKLCFKKLSSYFFPKDQKVCLKSVKVVIFCTFHLPLCLQFGYVFGILVMSCKIFKVNNKDTKAPSKGFRLSSL